MDSTNSRLREPLPPVRNKGGKYPRYRFEETTLAAHRQRPLTRQEEAEVAAAIQDLIDAPEGGKVEKFKALALLPVNLFPLKRAHPIDHGRYTGERLRAIAKAGGGPRERARAARRAAAAQGGGR